MNTIGATIKKLRGAKGVTQEELAEAVNISYQAVSKWENGGSPDLEMLPILANYFGVTIDELMGFKLAAYTNKERFIRLMADAGVLKRSKFEIKMCFHYQVSKKFTEFSKMNVCGEIFCVDKVI